MTLFSRTKAKFLIQNLKAKDKKVVFTNGCFDIIHKGHTSYLELARGLGDFLIIGLNSDTSVIKLKGQNRPINHETIRATNLLKLDYVDAVTIFSEETPRKIIEELQPDFLVKGGDYELENIVGADYVRSAGGEVVILPFVAGHSTTNIIEKQLGKDLTEEDAPD